MYLYTKNEIRLEKKIHRFIAKRYERIGRLEIFKVPENKHKKILAKIAKRFANWKDVKINQNVLILDE
jgi:hypothetical protein